MIGFRDVGKVIQSLDSVTNLHHMYKTFVCTPHPLWSAPSAGCGVISLVFHGHTKQRFQAHLTTTIYPSMSFTYNRPNFGRGTQQVRRLLHPRFVTNPTLLLVSTRSSSDARLSTILRYVGLLKTSKSRNLLSTGTGQDFYGAHAMGGDP
jgi:hypothetical protein